MGLKADITGALQEAYTTDLADAITVIDVTYQTTSYDTATGTVTATDTSVPSRAVIEPIDKSMVDGEVVLISDTSFLILADDLSLTPEVGHTIVADGTSYSINLVLTDPANVAWNIIARAV